MLNIKPPPADRQRGDPGVPDFGLIGTILDELHHDELIAKLNDYRWTGRPGYAPEVMWRATLVRYLLRLRYTRDLIAQLKASRLLRRVCGLRDTVPHEGTFSRFYARLADHKNLVDAAIKDVAERVGAEIERLRHEGVVPEKAPAPGRMVAIDSSDVEAWGNGKVKPDKRIDREAAWGHRTAKLAVDGEELFYGYKLHAVCDAYYGTPLAWAVLPANANDSPTLPPLVDQLKRNHSNLPVRYMMADRGYDALSNFKDLDDRRIYAVIQVREMGKDKQNGYTAQGQPRCLGGQPMQYVGTKKGKGHLFRCPAEGCELKGERTYLGDRCQSQHYEGWDGELLRRVGRLPRASKRWATLYKKRTSVERMFGSLKRSRLLDRHCYLGIKKVRLHVGLSLLTYTGTMLGRLLEDDYAGMREMKVEMPVANWTARAA